MAPLENVYALLRRDDIVTVEIGAPLLEFGEKVGRLSMGTCVHFSRSLPSNSWWQTMAGWQALSRPSAAKGGGRRPAFTGLATRPYSATEVDGWQHKLSRVSQNRAAVQSGSHTLFWPSSGIASEAG